MTVTSFLTFFFSHLRTNNQSRLCSFSPLCLKSEFPKDFYVSLVLLVFAIVLSTLAGEVGFFLFHSVLNQHLAFNPSSLAYFVAYLLVNILYLFHLFFYFAFHEEVDLVDDTLVIKQGILFFKRELHLKKKDLMLYNPKKNVWGGYYLELVYFTSDFRTRKILVGNYLHEEHLELLMHQIDSLIYWPKHHAGTSRTA